DSKGLVRRVYFARSYPNSIFPEIMGYVTRLEWQPGPGEEVIVVDEDPAGVNAGNSQGWGINVMHIHYTEYGGVNPYTGEAYGATTSKRDGFEFEQRPILLGDHHLIFRVTYRQYTSLLPDRRAVDVTVDWMFADGLDHWVYALTVDSTREFT